MLISPAYAQDAVAGAGGGLAIMLPLVLIFVVFYFLLIRPQQKKMKQHKDMLEAIRRGDKVVTGGGIIGTVTKVGNDDELTVEIADNIKVKVKRSMVSELVSKTEPASGEGASKEESKEGDTSEGDAPKGGGLKRLLGGK